MTIIDSAKKFIRKGLQTVIRIKISGNKITVKRPAPQSPANVREVSPMKGTQNQRHIQPNLPKSVRDKVSDK